MISLFHETHVYMIVCSLLDCSGEVLAFISPLATHSELLPNKYTNYQRKHHFYPVHTSVWGNTCVNGNPWSTPLISKADPD